MNYPKVILLTMTVLLITLVMSFKWFSSESTEAVLIIYLRCSEKMSGVLSVSTVVKPDKPGEEKSFDLGTRCQVGTIEFNGYTREESLQFTFKRDNSKTVQIIAEYGPDIQRDLGGFYMVLKITDVPPFIANDKI